jgi:hypothetical protein
MKRWFTALLVCFALCVCELAVADSTNYGRVLYRVNTGGYPHKSIDTSSVNWEVDNSHNPSTYVDTAVMGNKTFGTYDSITLDPSVPISTPVNIFQSERALRYWNIDSLEYHFPIAVGKKVEVRLYFAEIYFDSANTRIFDVYIENDLKLAHYDIFAEVGKDVGVMKKYRTTSDGTLNIYLKRVKQMPKINGIEIVELTDNTTNGVYYRVNTGGQFAASLDNSSVQWVGDDSNVPCPFVDTIASGNKTYGVYDTIFLSSSVPPSTPYQIFKTERDLARWDLKELTYNFPIPAGKTVQVRLYFSEIYFDSPGQRIFDIYINDQLMQKDYDIFAESGKDVGVMKGYLVNSTGNIKIVLKREKQQPKINGIEIVDDQHIFVTGIFGSSNNTKPTIEAYPNPFTNEVGIDLGDIESNSVKVLDSFGREIQVNTMMAGTKLNVNFDNQPKGIYFLKVTSDDKSETIRLIKD